MKKFCLSFIFCFPALCFSQRFQGADTFINHPALKNASVSISVSDLNTGLYQADYNIQQSLVPASTLKLVTTATALDMYGADYRFLTELEYSGTITPDGTLQGDIYITGAGDPTLGSENSQTPPDRFISDCINAIKKAGIKAIRGRIIADGSICDNEGVSPYWTWEDMGNYYAAGAYGVNYADNRYRLTLKSGEAGTIPEIIGTEPTVPNLTFTNNLTSKNINFDSAYIYGAPFQNNRTLCGAIPRHKPNFVVKGDIPDPALFAAQTLSNAISGQCISIEEPPTTDRLMSLNNEKSATNRQLLLVHESDKLSDIIQHINKVSDNFYTEALLRLIALHDYPSASAQKGIRSIRKYWEHKGINLNGLFMYDGCGLSTANRISAQVMNDILTYMANDSQEGESFINSIPLAGESGTVSNLLKDTKFKGKLRLKSGSIGNVQCYAGYYSGTKKYVVIVMVNHYTCNRSQLRKMIEKMLLSCPSFN
ncbi:MAG: D-alanyl-D-alanine carboxypeptidase/D-alanyl-D-alanine-endopeptidase [Bacteroidaceae bacterium]|nr:D-alanyl-D-alanine carboxypeptidase/D-alanyl-D-alanine-endopeptidase [Bacteroidaceae bacterium]